MPDVVVNIGAKQQVSEASKTAQSSIKQLGEAGTQAANKMKLSWTDLAAKFYLVEQALGVLNKGMQLAQASANFNQINNAFKNMSDVAGVSSKKVLDSISAAAGGTISKLDLVTSAARANLFKIPVEQMDDLMKVARASAIATGESVGKMFDDIVTGISRGSPMILDNLGLTIKISEANENYAASIGKSVSELTAQETKMALLNDVLRAGNEIITKVGDSTTKLTDAQKFQKMKAQVDDVKIAFGQLLVPLVGSSNIMSDALTKITDFLTNNREKIINFFAYLPEIAALSFNSIKSAGKQYLTFDYLFEYLKAYYQYAIQIVKSVFITWAAYANAAGTTIWEPLKIGFEWIIYGIRSLFSGLINFFIQKLNLIAENAYYISKVIADPGKWIAGLIDGKKLSEVYGGFNLPFDPVDFGGEKPGAINTNAIVDAWKNVVTVGFSEAQKIWDDLKSFMSAISKPIVDVMPDLMSRIQLILNRSRGGSSEAAQTDPDSPEAKTLTIWQRMNERLTGVWDSIKNFMLGSKGDDGTRQGGALNSVLNGAGNLIQILVNKFVALVTSTEQFQEIVGAINQLLQSSVVPLIEPLFEALRPLINLLIYFASSLATILFPVIEMLGILIKATMPLWQAIARWLLAVVTVLSYFIPIFAPIIELLANVLTPLLNTVAILFEALAIIIRILYPLFDALQIVLKIVLTPVAALGAVLQWLADIVYNVGKVMSNFVSHPFEPHKWDNNLRNVGNLDQRIRDAIGLVTGGNTTSGYADGLPEMPDAFSPQSPGTGSSIYGGNSTVQQAPHFEIHLHIGTSIGEDRLRIAEEVVQAIKERLDMGGTVDWLVAG